MCGGEGEDGRREGSWFWASLLPSRLVLSYPIFPVSAQCWGLGVGPSGSRWHQARAPSPETTPVSTIAPLWGSPSPPPCFPNHSSVASGLHGVCGTERLCHVSCTKAPEARGWSCSMHLHFFFLGVLAHLTHTSTSSPQSAEQPSVRPGPSGRAGVVPFFCSLPRVVGEADPVGADPSWC